MTKRELYESIAAMPIFSSHSHHLADAEFAGFDLDKLLRHSYVNWAGIPTGDTAESRRAYLELVRTKSYFVCIQRALRELYGLTGELTAENWEEWSSAIRDAHKDPNWHLTILRERCGYDAVVVDTYWEPGSDNGHGDLFCPTFRVDPFFCGGDKTARDHDGNNAYLLYPDLPEDFDGFFAYLRKKVYEQKALGRVALKCAIAYDRTLEFEPVTEAHARRGFVPWAIPADKKAFEDYLFHVVCQLAAETGMTLQVHTGMGQLTGTRPLSLKSAIERHPNTKFALFHCGYPWMGDMAALTHVYPNVYPDLCWMPILSPTAARRVLHELIEITTADKLCWGCDTWNSEDSYGAVLAFRDVLTDVLWEKIQSGYFTEADALRLAKRITFDNAAALYAR